MTPSSTSRSRRRRESPGHLAIAGLLTLAVISAVLLITLRAPNGAPGISRRSATVHLPDVGSLRAHNDVRIGGVLVGQVKDVTADGAGAQVTLQLFPSAGHLPVDSTAAVRSAGLLGQRYLQIIPGRSHDTLPDGGALRAAPRSITLGVPDALETFDAETRGGLADTARGLGAGVVGEGQNINAGIGAAPPAASDFRASVDAVLADPAAARALLPSMDDAAAALDIARAPLGALLAPADRALRPVAAERDAVAQTLTAAPPALTAARSGMAAADRLLATVHGLASAASHTLPRAPAALQATTALLRSSRTPLRGAAPLVRDARATVPHVLRLTRAVDPVLTPLREPLRLWQHPLDVLGAHGCDVVNFARVWRSFLGFGSVPGGRIGSLGEIRAEAIVNLPDASAGDVVKLPDALAERDLYPAPCRGAGSVHPAIP